MVGARIPGTKLLLLYHQKCHLAPHVGNPWGSHLAWIHTPTCDMLRPHVSGVPGDVNTVVSIPDLPLLLKEDYTYPLNKLGSMFLALSELNMAESGLDASSAASSSLTWMNC